MERKEKVQNIQRIPDTRSEACERTVRHVIQPDAPMFPAHRVVLLRLLDKRVA